MSQLDIQPAYSTALESTMDLFNKNWIQEDGTISLKGAEFAASALGNFKKPKRVQRDEDCATFDSADSHKQNAAEHCSGVIDTSPLILNSRTDEINKQLEMKGQLDELKINLIQDDEDEVTREQKEETFPCEDSNFGDAVTKLTNKSKRTFDELDMLDVAAATLPETKEGNLTMNCNKLHCAFGCVCALLESESNSKLFYNFNLAEEEQTLNQTVTGEKRLVLKGKRKNSKASKEYTNVHSNMSLEHMIQKTNKLSIAANKLNCDIEPWCMARSSTTDLNEAVATDPQLRDITSNIECLELSKDEEFERLKRNNSVKKSKRFVKSHTQRNTLQTSKTMHTTTKSNEMTENQSNVDLENEIQAYRILAGNVETEIRANFMPDFVNLEANVQPKSKTNKIQYRKSDSDSSDY